MGWRGLETFYKFIYDSFCFIVNKMESCFTINLRIFLNSKFVSHRNNHSQKFVLPQKPDGLFHEKKITCQTDNSGEHIF